MTDFSKLMNDDECVIKESVSLLDLVKEQGVVDIIEAYALNEIDTLEWLNKKTHKELEIVLKKMGTNPWVYERSDFERILFGTFSKFKTKKVIIKKIIERKKKLFKKCEMGDPKLTTIISLDNLEEAYRIISKKLIDSKLALKRSLDYIWHDLQKNEITFALLFKSGGRVRNFKTCAKNVLGTFIYTLDGEIINTDIDIGFDGIFMKFSITDKEIMNKIIMGSEDRRSIQVLY